jgi:hypothetical protein
MSRRLSRYVSCAKAMERNWSQQEKLRSRWLPRYRSTQRANALCGTRLMSCAKTVRPWFIIHSGARCRSRMDEAGAEFKSFPRYQAHNVLQIRSLQAY